MPTNIKLLTLTHQTKSAVNTSTGYCKQHKLTIQQRCLLIILFYTSNNFVPAKKKKSNQYKRLIEKATRKKGRDLTPYPCRPVLRLYSSLVPLMYY